MIVKSHIINMRNSIRLDLLNDKFTDSKTNINLPILINGLFGLIIFSIHSPHLWYCLASFIIILIFKLSYSWENPALNWFICAIYFLIILAELFFVGLPKQAIPHDQGMSKGIFLDILLGLVPFIYTGLRILSIIPLVQTSWISNKLSKYSI